MNITFYTDNIDPRIPEMQKKVFEKLGLKITQVIPEKWHGHGGTIDRFLTSIESQIDKQYETIVLWDVDCIPLFQIQSSMPVRLSLLSQ